MHFYDENKQLEVQTTKQVKVIFVYENDFIESFTLQTIYLIATLIKNIISLITY